MEEGLRIELIWLRIGTSGGIFWTRYYTFRFHQIWEILVQLSNWRLL
jgi:hypothetical protein